MKSLNLNPSGIESQILSAVHKTLGQGIVGLHEPKFHGNEIEYLKACVESTYVSSVGKFVNQFEEDLCKFTGAKYAIAVVNGTAALHLALLLAEVNRGDEVLIPSLTFIATANAVSYCGAIPHFVDVEEKTLGIDVNKLSEYLKASTAQKSGLCINLATGRRISAVVPMHVFGHPSDIEGLLELAREFRLKVVEDAAESLGSFYCDGHAGTYGLAGVLSFNGNKIITSGGGGAILTNDKNFALKAKHFSTTAKLNHPWEYRHDAIGFNYRMPNINAALGCAQLEQLEHFLKRKRNLFESYDRAFKSISGVKVFREPVNCKSNYWLQAILLDDIHLNKRDLILKTLNDAGFGSRPTWIPISDLEIYKNSPKMDLSMTSHLAQALVNLPSNRV